MGIPYALYRSIALCNCFVLKMDHRDDPASPYGFEYDNYPKKYKAYWAGRENPVLKQQLTARREPEHDDPKTKNAVTETAHSPTSDRGEKEWDFDNIKIDIFAC